MATPTNFAIDEQAALSFAIEQHTHIEASVNEAPRPEIQYPRLVDVDTSAPDYAKTITYFSSDMYGRAKWINGNSDDIPIAGTEMDKHEARIFTFGAGYRWGWEELGQAMHMNYPLQANDANAARRSAEEFVDRLVLRGDSTKNITGLYNNPNVVVNPATFGGWMAGTVTEDQINEDVNVALLGVGQATNFSISANTLLLPHTHYRILATRRLGDTSQTLLNYLMANNTYTAMTGQPLQIIAVRGLETASATGGPRMVAYRKDPDVVKLNMPMPHRFMGVYQDGPLNWVVPGVGRVGELEIRRTQEIQYVDNI